MSFLSVIKKIGNVALGIEHVAVPIAEGLDPALTPVLTKIDGWLNRTQVAIQSAEATFTAAKSGGMKAAAVEQDFVNGIQTAQDALAVVGKTLQYDSAAYQRVVADFVTAYNEAAAFKTTIKIVDLAAQS